mmetsp:Transcript_3349/g.9782  ORF Transcript_3349/g.9782 Transcript_3349/m.9782 type:complete len:234 (-) Transcript_3349:169-870(-)
MRVARGLLRGALPRAVAQAAARLRSGAARRRGGQWRSPGLRLRATACLPRPLHRPMDHHGHRLGIRQLQVHAEGQPRGGARPHQCRCWRGVCVHEGRQHAPHHQGRRSAQPGGGRHGRAAVGHRQRGLDARGLADRRWLAPCLVGGCRSLHLGDLARGLVRPPGSPRGQGGAPGAGRAAKPRGGAPGGRPRAGPAAHGAGAGLPGRGQGEEEAHEVRSLPGGFGRAAAGRPRR